MLSNNDNFFRKRIRHLESGIRLMEMANDALEERNLQLHKALQDVYVAWMEAADPAKSEALIERCTEILVQNIIKMPNSNVVKLKGK